MKFKPQISKRGSKHYFAEIALTRGPRAVAYTGTGSFDDLFGYAWLGLLDRAEQRFRLFQLQESGAPWRIGSDPTGAEWVEIPTPPLHHQTKELRHLGLAFDQSARHVVAYERAGEIWVRQWDAGAGDYAMRGPWPGVDPVVIMDALVGGHVPDSDVLLFHLSADRRSLVMRAQREVYTQGHVIEQYAGAVILDQAVDVPYQVELLGSTADQPNEMGLVVRSDLYPVRVEDRLAGAGVHRPGSGAYYPVVIVRELGAERLAGPAAMAPSEGNYFPLVVQITLPVDSISHPSVAAPAAGVYYPVVVMRDVGVDTLVSASTSAPGAGIYEVAVVVVDFSETPYSVDSLGAVAANAPSGGSYVEA